MSVLEVHDVSIRYITGDFRDIRLKEYLMKRLKGEYQVAEFWADRNVSFTLDKGEMPGIIGTNGAGKSTLLKAVSGIMEPTTGYVRREGNISALLELASGFDGDLTVRENAYLRRAMLGYTRRFMDEVLSVGDGGFRKKSEAKMREIIAGGSATILVSHSIQQVQNLCTKILWLEKGQQIALSEDVAGICAQYQEFLNGGHKL